MSPEERIALLVRMAARAESESEKRKSDYGRGLLDGLADGYRLAAQWLAEDNNIKV